MNLFILDESPIYAAMSYCDKHVPKLIVECFQMLGSAQRRHGAQDADMPLTSKGTPLLGGYHNHPATRWVGATRENYFWTCFHAAMLCEEFEKRFGKTHSCAEGIEHLYMMADRIPEGELTEFAQCMPDEYKRCSKRISGVLQRRKSTLCGMAQGSDCAVLVETRLDLWN